MTVSTGTGTKSRGFSAPGVAWGASKGVPDCLVNSVSSLLRRIKTMPDRGSEIARSPRGRSPGATRPGWYVAGEINCVKTGTAVGVHLGAVIDQERTQFRTGRLLHHRGDPVV